MNLIGKCIPDSGGIKSKNINKPFNKFMNRRVEFWNDHEITTTLTAPGTMKASTVREICSIIHGKTSVKKLVNKCGCYKNCAMFNRKSM